MVACSPATSISSTDVPPFSRAAMDGYAVRAEDTTGASPTDPRTLRCIEQVFTGQVATRRVEAGTCTEIATGAPMPDGADAVVMVEDTNRDASGVVKVFAAVTPRQNVGRQGSDIQNGQTLLAAGDVLNASRVGSIAALGIAEVDVYARPRVAILSTGNEIVEPGQPLQPGQIYDINKFTLSVGVRRTWRRARSLPHCRRHDRRPLPRGGRMPPRRRAGVFRRKLGRASAT